jgi:hypothetical protein
MSVYIIHKHQRFQLIIFTEYATILSNRSLFTIIVELDSELAIYIANA